MSDSWQYYLIKMASRFISLLPYRVVLYLGRLLGALYYRVAARQRRRAMTQLQECLAVSLPEAENIVRTLFVNLSQTFFEVLYMPSLTPSNIQKLVTIENRHYLEEALVQGKGVIALSAHIGNWEWLGAALAMNGFPVASVTKPQPNQQHTRILNEYRQKAGIASFSRDNSEVIGAAKALKQGRVLGFFIDQDGGPGGIFTPFLGKMSSTPQGAAAFARKFQSPIVPVFIVRRPGGGHRIIVRPYFNYEDTGHEERDMYNLTLKMNRIIEDTIRAYPDEWLWFQKRWNTPFESQHASIPRMAGEVIEKN